MTSSDTIYRSDSGRYYSTVELWRHFESGEWAPFKWDEATEKEWVETDDGEILELTPITVSELPASVTVEETDYGPVVQEATEE
jgi:hypothetical protein